MASEAALHQNIAAYEQAIFEWENLGQIWERNIHFYVGLTVTATPETWKRDTWGWKHRKKKERAEKVILSQSGRRPKATKTVLHVKPTNISEVLNMNPTKPGEKGASKRKIKRWKEKEKVKSKWAELLSIATPKCFSNMFFRERLPQVMFVTHDRRQI